MELVIELECLKEEYDGIKFNFFDFQCKIEDLQKENSLLRDDKIKLDNKLIEEMNYNKVKIVELEVEKDILEGKIKKKDDFIKKYEE